MVSTRSLSMLKFILSFLSIWSISCGQLSVGGRRNGSRNGRYYTSRYTELPPRCRQIVSKKYQNPGEIAHREKYQQVCQMPKETLPQIYYATFTVAYGGYIVVGNALKSETAFRRVQKCMGRYR